MRGSISNDGFSGRGGQATGKAVQNWVLGVGAIGAWWVFLGICYI